MKEIYTSKEQDIGIELFKEREKRITQYGVEKEDSSMANFMSGFEEGIKYAKSGR